MDRIDKNGVKIGRFFCLTNPQTCAIIIKLLHGAAATKNRLKKVFQKNLKKPLTNDLKCGIINKLSQRTG